MRPNGQRKTSIRQQQERVLFTRKKTNEPTLPDSSQPEGDDAAIPGYRQTGAPSLVQLEDPDNVLDSDETTHTDLDMLVSAYASSEVASAIRNDTTTAIQNANSSNSQNGGILEMNGHIAAGKVKGYRKTGLIGQFIILSKRTWRNLYRNPMLMLTHYAIAIVLAVFLGFLFYGLTDDIAGFQNRLGLFFFLLALFGFSTLTTLYIFTAERLLFVRERAKGYYSPISYFAAKVLFDIVPLRLIPPLITGAIVYPMTGLIPQGTEFAKFILFLVLFNLAAAGICLFLGIVIDDGGVANLVGSLVMLFSLLFAGFLLNRDSIPGGLGWLQKVRLPFSSPFPCNFGVGRGTNANLVLV
jgi:hypothetical protein